MKNILHFGKSLRLRFNLSVVFTLALGLLSTSSWAQVSTYTFSQSVGTYGTYVGAGAGAVGGAALNDDGNYTVALPFAFTYGGTLYPATTTLVGINTNGWIRVAGAPVANSYTVLSDASNFQVVAGFNRDLQEQRLATTTGTWAAGSTTMTVANATNWAVGMKINGVTAGVTPAGIPAGTIVTNVVGNTITMSQAATLAGTNVTVGPASALTLWIVGTAPNRSLVIQFTRYKRFGALTAQDNYNFQIWLNEGGGVAANQTVQVRYGTCTSTSITAIAPMVGLKGLVATDFNSRRMGTWAASAASTANTQSMSHSSTVFPVSGTIYTWTPGTSCTGTPNSGTATISSSSGCPSVNFNLSATGHSTGIGITYQWEFSTTSATGPWSNVAGGTTVPFTTSAAVTTWYRLKTTCTNSGLVNYSSVVSYTPGGGLCACGAYPALYATTTADEEITNVTVGTMNNSSVCGTTAPGAGSIAYRYSNYTGAVVATSQFQGATVNFSLTQTSCGGAFSNFFQIYVDWNQDGDWLDLGEQVYSQGASIFGNQTATGSFVVPLTATLGTTRMRVVNIEGTAGTANYAHSTYGYGETEDYCFTVTAPVGCSGTPNAGTASISLTSGCPSVNFNLSATGVTTGGGISYQWQSGPTATGPWTNVPGGTTIPFTTSTATTTFYQLVTTCSNSGLTNASNAVSYTVSSGVCACGPYPLLYATSTADEEITNVTVGALNNSSVCGTVAPGAGSVAYMYSNYTGAVAGPSEFQGASVNFSLTQTTCGGAYGNIFQIYVDWNQDGDWLDLGEQVFSQATTVVGNQTVTGSFVVPVTATVGTTRMRVVNVETTPATTNYAHSTYLWGESEDYCFTVTTPPGCTGTPNAGTATISLGTGCAGISFNLNATGLTAAGGIAYQWESAPALAGPWAPIVGATTPTHATTATSTTYYRLKTSCANSGLTNYTNVVSYTVVACCTYSFVLTDAFGDGWNGAIMEVRQGTSVVATLGPTFTAGTTLTIPVTLGQSVPYTLYYSNGGAWPTEVGIQIIDPNGNTLYTLGAGLGAVGTTLYSWNGDCTPPVASPTAVTANVNPVCNGSSVMLTAVGSSGTTYWFTTGCTTTGQIGTGSSITVSPTTTTTYYARNNNGTSWSTACASLTVTVTPVPTVNAGSGSTVCSGNPAQLTATAQLTTSTTYAFTGGVQTFTVPAGVTSVTVDASGAQGGLGFNCPAAVPGLGGRVQATIAVTPGDVLNIYVGGQGGAALALIGGTAGYNGGGTGGSWSGGRSGGGGGGASDIRLNGTALTNRVIVAAGGGGTGVNFATGNAGGNGGGLTGANGLTGTYLGAGATQTAGGAPDGTLGQGGNAPGTQTGGGGGGGYYGGGSSAWEGGGGGSSYSGPTASAVTLTAGSQTGNGVVTLTYLGTPSVTWTPSASLSSSTILNPVATPTTTTTYTISATNGGCTATSPVTITVTQPPALPTSSAQSVCYGANAQVTASALADWYTVPTGGTSIGSATTYTTPALTATTTYYMEGASNGCPPTARNPVTVTVNPFPNTVPGVTSPSTGCNIYSPSAWTYFVNPGNEIVTCVWSGVNLNAVTADVQVLSTVPYLNGVPYIPRVVTISPAAQGTAQVRLYFTLQEFQDLQAVSPLLTSITDLGVTKFDAPNLTGNPTYLQPTAYLTPAQTGIPNVYAVEVLTPSFSTFTIHYNYGNTVLPVEYTSASATCDQTGVMVEWSTASETNCSHYEVYRSSNGGAYERVGTVTGSGTTSEAHNYRLYDMYAAEGTNYYRIDQVDVNGAVNSAPIIVATCGMTSTHASLFPNPTDNTSVLYYPSKTESVLNISVLDVNNKVVESKQVNLTEGRNAIPFDWSGYTPGVYMIRTEHDGQYEEFRQVIIQ